MAIGLLCNTIKIEGQSPRIHIAKEGLMLKKGLGVIVLCILVKKENQ